MEKQLTVVNPKILLLFGVFGVSFSSIFIKYSEAPSLVIATYRLGWTVFILLPIVVTKFRGEISKLEKNDVLWNILSGFFLAIHFSVWFESLKFTSVASSTILVSTEVIFAAIGFVVIFKGKINKKGILAMAITFAGSVVIAMNDCSGGKNVLYGDCLALLGAVMVAVYTLIGKKQRDHISTTVYTFITYSACLVTLLLFDFFTDTAIYGYGIKEIILGLLLGISCTLLGHSVFSWCLKYLSPSFVSSTKLLEPVFASALAVLIYGEVPGVLQIIGGIVVIGGVYLYSQYE
ncbi:DMT family transporter [Clostridium sp.]|nr:DMT family transporter [Clostridium sp.]MCI1716772.1 DMT family transporter [Clostridium sp.]MCI1801044.1 DMT family transporter [Clostridium sp.]MCI1814958.1 DMT family transporter [Clostridium sp.]MCI1871859.1 DMT family transporter [Clostridium sp.]MCI2200369.1 DMT family transporter [Clostridium sp.]